MIDSLAGLGKNPIVQNLLKKAGVNPPPNLKRAKGPWAEKIVQGKKVLVGGQGPALNTVCQGLASTGASLVLSPGSKASLGSTKHDKLESFDDETTAKSLNGILFDGTQIKTSEDLKAMYEFFHQALAHLKGNTRIVILGSIPEEQKTPLEQTMSRALIGFSKRVSKELGPKGSNVQLVQLNDSPESHKRCASICQFFLSDHSAFITGQVIRCNELAAAPKNLDIAGSLKGKVALVTGAVGGIGLACAKTFAAEGAKVLCLDHESQKEKLEALAKEIDGVAIPLSLGQPDNPAQLEEIIKGSTGHVDILVHNAGITRDKTLKRMNESHWDQVIAVNLQSIIDITEHFVAKGILKDFGKVICLSSISGLAGNFGQANYASAKAGLIAYVDALSNSLAKKGITANAVAPGFIETPMTAKMPVMTRTFARRLASLSQGGLPEDVAQAICFLSSEASQGINGSVLRVCGGHMMGA